MKRLQPLFLGTLIIATVLLLGVRQLKKTSGMSGAEVLTIYNWGDYINPSLITKPEKGCGYKVNYETFDSNEMTFTEIQQSRTNCDIAVPGEYMIQKMIKERLMLPLDHSKIKGLSNTDPRFLDLDFDLDNQYSIPYFWGTLGIIYNDKLFNANQTEHWDDLWKPELEDSLMLIDGAREVMGLSSGSLGYSLNSKSMAQLTEAANRLNHLTPNVKATMADEVKTYTINEEAFVTVTSPGEAIDMMQENERLHYVTPSEESNLWFDNIVVPKTVKSEGDAYDSINFALEPENAAQNTEYIGYSIPNEEAKALLPEDISSDEQFCPSDDTTPHLEIYKDLGSKYLDIYNDLFLGFKVYRR